MQAYGIVSLIDIYNDPNARFIWHQAAEILGRYNLSLQSDPHFSWQVAKNYDIKKTIRTLSKIAEKSSPFKVSISGLGIFTGENPILYFPIVRTELLNIIHKRIWDSCSKFGGEISSYYSGSQWIPHITLAYNPIDPITLSKVVQEMSSKQWQTEIEISAFVLAYQNDEESGILQSIPFHAEER